MKKYAAMGAWFALLSLWIVPLASAGPQDTVDFSLAPAKGLKFKVTEKQTTKTEGSITIDDMEPRPMNGSTKKTTIYTQTILDVKDGKIVKLEREYEESGTTRESDRSPEPQERESPLAWKHVRAEWKDDECKVEVKEDDEWTEPGGGLKRHLSPGRLRNPLIPLPGEAKNVGDSWELDEEALKKFFGKTRPPTGMGEDAPEIERKASFKFTHIVVWKEMKCAAIKMKLKVSAGEIMSQTSDVTCFYSLKHRIVVGMKGTGSQEVNASREMGSRSMKIESSGTSQINTEVKILEEDEKSEEE